MAKRPPPQTLNLGNILPDVFPPLSELAGKQPDLLPASVLGAWDTLRTSLGQTVPANVTRAKSATGRLLKAVR